VDQVLALDTGIPGTRVSRGRGRKAGAGAGQGRMVGLGGGVGPGAVGVPGAHPVHQGWASGGGGWAVISCRATPHSTGGRRGLMQAGPVCRPQGGAQGRGRRAREGGRPQRQGWSGSGVGVGVGRRGRGKGSGRGGEGEGKAEGVRRRAVVGPDGDDGVSQSQLGVTP